MDNQEDKLPNYCHDNEIKQVGKHMGVTGEDELNRAYSIGEGAYNAQDAAENFLSLLATKKKKSKQPRSALSKKQKQAILSRRISKPAST